MEHGDLNPYGNDFFIGRIVISCILNDCTKSKFSFKLDNMPVHFKMFTF